MFNYLLGAKRRERKLIERAPEGPLKLYLSTAQPDPKSDIYSVSLLALDFETTGLNASDDKILSIGYVTIESGEIQLSTACHQLVKNSAILNEENVVIHKITDDDSARGEEIEIVIGGLLQRLTGCILLAHHARVEISFLKNACKKIYGICPDFPVIDTLSLARQWHENRNKEMVPENMRLFALREQYGLPAYSVHNALSDALATAELFLAQVEHMDSKAPLPLRRFLS